MAISLLNFQIDVLPPYLAKKRSCYQVAVVEGILETREGEKKGRQDGWIF